MWRQVGVKRKNKNCAKEIKYKEGIQDPLDVIPLLNKEKNTKGCPNLVLKIRLRIRLRSKLQLLLHF